jgi:chromosome segregation ATPase
MNLKWLSPNIDKLKEDYKNKEEELKGKYELKKKELDLDLQRLEVKGIEEINQDVLQTQRDNIGSIEEAEHEYHSKKQKYDTEIARKEEKIAALDKMVELNKKVEDANKNTYEQLLFEKNEALERYDREIQRYKDLVEKLLEKLPKVELDRLNINVDTEIGNNSNKCD